MTEPTRFRRNENGELVREEPLTDAECQVETVTLRADIREYEDAMRLHDDWCSYRAENERLKTLIREAADHEECDCPGPVCLIWLRMAKALGGDA